MSGGKGQLPVGERCRPARAPYVAAARELAGLGGLCPPAAGGYLKTRGLGCRLARQSPIVVAEARGVFLGACGGFVACGRLVAVLFT